MDLKTATKLLRPLQDGSISFGEYRQRSTRYTSVEWFSKLFKPNEYDGYTKADLIRKNKTVQINGQFTPEELEAIVFWVGYKNGPA